MRLIEEPPIAGVQVQIEIGCQPKQSHGDAYSYIGLLNDQVEPLAKLILGFLRWCFGILPCSAEQGPEIVYGIRLPGVDKCIEGGV